MRPRGSGSLLLVDGIWHARYYHHGQRVQEATGFREDQRSKAETFLRAKVKAADTPAFVDPAARKLSLPALLDVARREHARRGNRSRLEYKLAHLAAHFGDTPALAITSEAVDAYADARLAAGAQPGTVNRELAALRRAFRLVVRKDLLPRMPHVTLRREDNTRQGFLDPPDFAALLAALRDRDPLVADVTECAYFTCLRRTNVLRLQWPDVAPVVDGGRLVAGELRLASTQTKNRAPLTLPLTGRLLGLFARRWDARHATSLAVFQVDGRALTRFDDCWRAATAAIGRPGFLFHDLRRSGARALRRAGVDEQTIMALGGWKTRSMFTRYAIVDSRDLAEAQAKLEDAFATSQRPQVVPLRRTKRPRSS
jgi:site-specific recombinase XerD